jgi:hypothetical protein
VLLILLLAPNARAALGLLLLAAACPIACQHSAHEVDHGDIR